MPEMPFGHVTTPKVWNGSCIWQEGVTPFGFYDKDPMFQDAAVKFSKFAAIRLGYPLMDVELDSGSFFTCLEEAITEYGNQIYQYKIRENYLAMEGGRADVPANGMIIEPTLQRIVEIAKNYGTEANVGGNLTMYHGMLDLQPLVQEYDLDAWAKNQGVVGGIEIRRIFYEAPPAIMRYFDPYAGTGTGIQNLMDAFDFGSYSPGINFLLMPVSADILKLQAIEFNDTVRKSAYSFEVHNNKLTIFPIPQNPGSRLRIEYYRLADKKKLNTNVKLINTMSTHRMPFSVKAERGRSVTETFQHNLGTREVTVQVYEQTPEGTLMMIPEAVKVLTENSISVTFAKDTTGYLVIGYPENGIVVPSVGGDPGIIKHCIDFSVEVPVGATSPVRRVFRHNLGTQDLRIQVFRDQGTESQAFIPADIEIVDNNHIAISFSHSVDGHAVLQATYEDLGEGSDVITNVAEVPYENPVYSKINSVGRQWIFRYALALAREILGYIRGKYTTVPIPDSEVTLNQNDLLADARQEKKDLIDQLRDMLDDASRQKQLERKAQEAEFLEKTLKGVPMLIYIG